VTLDVITGEVVPAMPAVPLTMGVEAAAAYMREYRAACLALLTPDDMQGGYINRSGYRTLAIWALVSSEILDESEVRDEDDRIVRAYCKVRASSPNGRYMDGIGRCARKERGFGNKEDHDIPAIAHTRALNRACSDLFGLGAVSYEEVRAGGADRGATDSGPAQDDPGPLVDPSPSDPKSGRSGRQTGTAKVNDPTAPPPGWEWTVATTARANRLSNDRLAGFGKWMRSKKVGLTTTDERERKLIVDEIERLEAEQRKDDEAERPVGSRLD
jgi:hypothetical protein